MHPCRTLEGASQGTHSHTRLGDVPDMLRVAAVVVVVQGVQAAVPTRLSFNVSAEAAADAAGAAVAGEMLMFAGGKGAASELADVTVYSPRAGWVRHKGVLSGARSQMASTQLPDGSVALFGGGEDAAKIKYGAVDMFTASSGVWSTANLSQPRSFLAAASVVVGSRALSLFAGGECSEGRTGTDSARVDLWEHGKGWVVQADLLSKPRKKLAAASAGMYIVIGGGYTSGMKNSTTRGYSDVVDLFHAGTGKWSTAKLSQPRQYIVAASAGDIAAFGGGFCSPCTGQTGTDRSVVVDIFDSRTLEWQVAKLSQRRSNLAATSVAGRYAIFGGGSTDLPNPHGVQVVGNDQDRRPEIGRSNVVDIYDAQTEKWSQVLLSGDGRCCLGAAGGNRSFAFFGGSQPAVADVFEFSSE